MLRVAIADVHLSEYKNDNIMDSGYPRRLNDIKMTLTNICEFCKTNNIQYIDLLGDIHNDKNIIHTDSQNVLKDVILAYPDIIFSMLSGNHDMSSTGDTQTSTISAFEGYSNVRCYTETCISGGLTIIPYSSHIIDDIKNAESNGILLSHIGLSEAVLQSGISIVSSISMNDLSKFRLVLLGHYHKPQHIRRENTDLYYIGSLIHKDWNDKNEDKRFIVYDTETYEITSVPINWITEYREFVIDDRDTADLILRMADEEKNNGNIVRVRNQIKKEELTDNQIKLLTEQYVIDDTEIDITARNVSSSMTQIDIFKAYLKDKDVPIKEHSEYMNIITKSLAKELYVEDSYVSDITPLELVASSDIDSMDLNMTTLENIDITTTTDNDVNIDTMDIELDLI